MLKYDDSLSDEMNDLKLDGVLGVLRPKASVSFRDLSERAEKQPLPKASKLIGRLSVLNVSGRPIRGATVRVANRSGFTDLEGRFQVDLAGLIPPLDVVVEARKIGRLRDCLKSEDLTPGTSLLRNYQLMDLSSGDASGLSWIPPKELPSKGPDWLIDHVCLCPAAATFLGAPKDDDDFLQLMAKKVYPLRPRASVKGASQHELELEMQAEKEFLALLDQRLNQLFFHSHRFQRKEAHR